MANAYGRFSLQSVRTHCTFITLAARKGIRGFIPCSILLDSSKYIEIVAWISNQFFR